MDMYSYFVAFGIVQLLHSQEEIWTNFHKQWFVFTMPRWVFIFFETAFSILIVAYIFKPDLPLSDVFMPFFALLMFVNGLGHIVWGLVERKYVPGLVTAPLFIVIFLAYFYALVQTAQ